MPVEDHEVHPSTKVGPEHRYGCFNHERADGYWARNGHSTFNWQPRVIWIKDGMSKECRHDHSLTDPCCAGCKYAGTGEVYTNTVVTAA